MSVLFLDQGAKVDSDYYCTRILVKGVLPKTVAKCGGYTSGLCSRTARHSTLLEILPRTLPAT